MPETKKLEKFPLKSYALIQFTGPRTLESSLFLPAVPAIDGLPLGRLERHFALRTALGTDRFVHLAWAAIETASAAKAASSSAEAAFVFVHLISPFFYVWNRLKPFPA